MEETLVEIAGGELGATAGNVVLVSEGVSGDAGDVGNEDGRTGVPGPDCMPGTPGKENNSLAEGIKDATPG